MALQRRKIDLGYKERPLETKSINKDRTHYPSFYISKVRLPVTANDVGKSFTVQAVIDLTGIRESTDTQKSSFNYDFEVKSIQFK
jgi:hypothetical protein